MNKIKYIFSIPKSLYINIKSLPLKQAIKLPILVSYKTKLISLRGKIVLLDKAKYGMIRIGFDGAGTAKHMSTVIENNGIIYLGNNVKIGGGCQICTVSKNSRLEIKKNVSITSESHIIASKNISIGNDSIISWNTQIMDTDFHKILDKNNNLLNEDLEILIGNNVWIASNVNILKGSNVPNNTVISSGSIIRGFLYEENCIYTGLPIKILKSNIIWKK
ncbi:acyltransferase [Megamonas funiformis]|uniref:acyltransferase n=1 Tax=Megamonas funiformis TaxID=437897 RepID=UPI00265DD48E|nr:hypothetical protein [Megamonas funiformis]